MKKILPILFIAAFCFSAKAQFPGTDSLRNFNNRFTTNNALQAFTNLRMHNLLAGMIDWIDSARFGAGGTIGIDTLYAVNDSTLRYRKNGVFRTFIVRGTAWAGKIYEVPFSNGFGRFYHDSNFVFINSTPDASQLTVGPITVIDGGLSKVNITSDNMNALALTAYGTGLNTIIARRAAGSVAVPAGITNGSDLWNFSGRGYSGTQWSGTRAGFYSRANQNWTDSTQGTFISFQTTHNDSIIPYDRFILDHDGHVVLKAYSYLSTVIDTSVYKPLVYNKNTGYLEPSFSWAGTGAIPGGSTGQVQTNISNALHGDGGLTYDTLRHTVTTDSVRAIRINSDTVRIKIANSNSAKNAYFFGTSITLGYYTQDASSNLDSSRRWSTYVCRSEGWTERNYGIAGLLMQNRSPSTTNMLTNRLSLIPVYNPATDTAIFFEFGINDATKTGQGLTNYNTTNFITDYTTTLDTAIVRHWPLNIIHTIASNYVDTSLNLFNTYSIQLAYYNATKTVAANLGVDLIDVYQNSFVNRNNFFYSDGLHPSNTGHSIYAIKVLASLGASVVKNNQTLAVNGLTELQKIKIKQTDTTNINYQVIGIDQYNSAIKIPNGYFIENSPLVKQYGGINLFGDIFGTRLQATGLVRAMGNRVGTNLTGSGPEIYWDGSTSYLSSLQETPSVAWKPLDINQGGSNVGIGIAHNTTDPVLTTSICATGYMRAKGSFPSTFTGGDEVFIGTVSHVGYIASFDGTGLTGRALSINNWGHNVMIGTDVDNSVGALQVTGKLTVTSHSISSNSDSALVWNRSTKDYQIARINGIGITSINGQTGPAYTMTTGTGLTSSLGTNSITVSVDNNSTDITHVVDKQFTDANNSGTSETDLYTKSIAANTLVNNGASIHFDVAGQLNDATATADIQFYFGGTSFGNTGALTLSATGAWSARGYVIRATSTTARAFVTFTTQSASTASYTFETDLTGLDFTTGNILKVTGQAGGATGGSNDITAKTWKLIFQP